MQKRTRRHLVAPLVVTAAAAAALSVVASGAWFTAETSVGGNGFSTGTVDIAAGVATTQFNVTDMAPGESAYAGVEMTNSGSLELRYEVTVDGITGDALLASTLQREVRVIDINETCEAGTFVSGQDIGGGAQSYDDPSVINSTARVLVPGFSERLCFKVDLPDTADNAVAGMSISDSTFTFSAEQTKNH